MFIELQKIPLFVYFMKHGKLRVTSRIDHVNRWDVTYLAVNKSLQQGKRKPNKELTY